MYESLYYLQTLQTKSEKIIFAAEPGEHSLFLTRQDNDKLKIEIFWSDEWEEMEIPSKNSTKKELVYFDTDTLENFIEVVCIGTQDLLQRMTLDKYKSKWNLFDFPLDKYNKLKKQ